MRYRRCTHRVRGSRARSAPRGSYHAGLEARLDLLAIELAADEHETVVAGSSPPRPFELAIEHHVHSMKDIAPVFILEAEHALHAEDVLPLALHQVVEPLVELAAID